MWHPFSTPDRSRSVSPRPSRHRRAASPRLEGLEGRVVLSASFDSVLTIGNDATNIQPSDVAVDSAGNSYVTGVLYSPTDFDPANDRPDGKDILSPSGTSDAFVAKYAADNTLVWARRMGSDHVNVGWDAYENASAVRVDGAGNVYVSGTFWDQADFGASRLTSAGNADAFVSKIDPSGNTLWARGWGGAEQDHGNEVAVDAAGNVVSVGSSAFWDDASHWIENASQVRKYSATGAAVWSHRFAGPTHGATGVATDAAGNVYVSGKFSGTVDFNPSPGKVNAASGHYGSAYILKLTSAGAYGWVSSFATDRTLDPGAFVALSDIAVDTSGNVIVGGYYQGKVDLDPSSKVVYRPPNTRPLNGFVAKLTGGGSLAWARQTGGDRVNAVAIDASGSVYATGSFGAGGFSPGSGLPSAPSQGSSDVYVSKFTASGTPAWARTFGGVGAESCNGLAVTASGEIYLAGYYFPGTVDFDPDPLTARERANAAYADLFLLRLRQA